MLNIPLGVFFGIVKSDEPDAKEVIEDDVENKPVLFIEVFDAESEDTIKRETESSCIIKKIKK